jgi:SAM-dependent methyltransferase
VWLFRRQKSKNEAHLDVKNEAHAAVSADEFGRMRDRLDVIDGKIIKDERSITKRGKGLEISTSPSGDYPHTTFGITRTDGEKFSDTLDYSHVALATLLAEYDFDTVFEIGAAAGSAARAMKFCGKRVYTVEIMPTFGADFVGDYLEINPGMQFDAIWCSHVLEHQRYLARFLERIYDDLRDGGVFALTVPRAVYPLLMGHCNVFTGAHLIYQLVLAGFDCADARIRCYDWQTSVIVTKKANGISRQSFASTQYEGDLAPGYVKDIISSFPRPWQPSLAKDGAIWGDMEKVNWE